MARSTTRTTRMIILAFIAGAIGVVIFHQGLLYGMHALGLVPSAPYSMQPTAPFGVPKVYSIAFWGGLWGIALVWFMTRVRGADRLWVAIVFGGILPSLGAALVVTPLKGGNMAAWLSAATMLRAFVINGVWGLGTALAYRAGRLALR